jgi:biopolymer transport protein TolQ
MDSESLNIVEMISNAGPVVQFVLLVLILFSVATWAIIIIKFRYLRKAFLQSDEFVEFFWTSRDLSSAYAKAKQLSSSPVARTFRIGYAELKKLSQSGMLSPVSTEGDNGNNNQSKSHFFGIDNVKRALRRSMNTESTHMIRLVPFLATTGSSAPFIGLFGTVWGIMNSFHGIGQRGSASLAVVAPGISEALIATAVGLAAAIPAVIAYNYFTNRIRTIESEMQSFYADFLNIVERDILSAKEGRHDSQR